MGQIALFCLRVLAWSYYGVPELVRRGLGNFLGSVFRVANIRAAVVRQNLQIAFPSSQTDSLFNSAYQHLGRLILEIVMLFGPMRKYVESRVDLSGLNHWTEAKKQGHGVIMLSSHVGNWEVMAAAGVIHGGIDIMIVTKHLKPEWLHQAIEAGRARCGVLGTYEPRTLKDVLAHLKKGKTIGFVLDQYAGPPVGVRVPFFGVPVGTAMIVATLARRTGCAVLPVVNYRTSDGRWKVEISAPLPWVSDANATKELALNTAQYASVIETHVRAHPEQWLWSHRRFKGDLSPLRPGEWEEGRART